MKINLEIKKAKPSENEVRSCLFNGLKIKQARSSGIESTELVTQRAAESNEINCVGGAGVLIKTSLSPLRKKHREQLPLPRTPENVCC